MKQKIISMFFVSILMIASFSIIVESDNIADNKDNSGKFLIPSNEKNRLEEFIEETKGGEVSKELETIKNRVVISYEEDNENVDIDLNELSKVIEEYNYEGIPKTGAVNPVDELINLIISMIEGRLGWVYQLIDQVTVIIQEAKLIWTLSENTIKTALDLYQNVKEVLNLTRYLLNGQISNFTRGWYPKFYINHIQDIISDLQSIINTIPRIADLINQTIQDCIEFTNWLNDEPWKKNVYIYGSVKKIEGLTTSPIEGVEIYCREKSNVTDKDGAFNFEVSIDDNSTDSLPSNSWYGLHNCTVIAKKDSETKKTTIPYVFSGGEIYKVFFFKEKEENSYKEAKDNSIIQKICSFLDNFFANFIHRFLK